MSGNYFNIDENGETEYKFFNKYIGIGFAEKPPPNREYREKLVENTMSKVPDSEPMVDKEVGSIDVFADDGSEELSEEIDVFETRTERIENDVNMALERESVNSGSSESIESICLDSGRNLKSSNSDCGPSCLNHQDMDISQDFSLDDNEEEKKLDDVLEKFAKKDTCFDPHLRYSEKDSHIYTVIEDLSRPNEIGGEETGNSILHQPWHPEYDNRSKCVADKYETLITTYFEQWTESIEVFETLVHDIQDIPLSKRRPLKSFHNLYAFENEEGRGRKMMETMRFVVRLAYCGGRVLPKRIRRLLREKSADVTLSQKQCAVLVAIMFLGMTSYNFYRLFGSSSALAVEKLKFFLCYFQKLQEGIPDGNITFRRKVISWKSAEELKECKTLISSLEFYTSDTLRIEESHGCSQMDFANEFIGGGVLLHGAVQEEIRFLMCPEMLVSMLLCDKMQPTEAIFIVGAQMYSSYEGYGRTLKWKSLNAKHAAGNLHRDEYGRLRNELIAIDAYEFGRAKSSQYQVKLIEREITKLIAGFGSNAQVPISTGWWGCGVFGGDKQLKSLLQVIAATIVGRPLIFCTFGETELRRSLRNIVRKLSEKSVSVGLLFHLLSLYGNVRASKSIEIFDYLIDELDRRHQ